MSIFYEEDEYNGFIIDRNGIRTNPQKTKAVLDAPVPTNLKELQRFIGAINYYGKFIKDFATIAKPLFTLLQKNVEYHWSKEQQSSYELLKDCLVNAPLLTMYDKRLPLKLDTDASSYGLGAVLSHVYPDGSEKPIAYASRSLNSSELKYSQVDKEGAAIIFALKKFYQYLMGRHFQLVVDNKAIMRIFHPHKQMSSVAANRLMRRSIIMASYDYEIK